MSTRTILVHWNSFFSSASKGGDDGNGQFFQVWTRCIPNIAKHFLWVVSLLKWIWSFLFGLSGMMLLVSVSTKFQFPVSYDLKNAKPPWQCPFNRLRFARLRLCIFRNSPGLPFFFFFFDTSWWHASESFRFAVNVFKNDFFFSLLQRKTASPLKQLAVIRRVLNQMTHIKRGTTHDNPLSSKEFLPLPRNHSGEIDPVT